MCDAKRLSEVLLYIHLGSETKTIKFIQHKHSQPDYNTNYNDHHRGHHDGNNSSAYTCYYINTVLQAHLSHAFCTYCKTSLESLHYTYFPVSCLQIHVKYIFVSHLLYIHVTFFGRYEMLLSSSVLYPGLSLEGCGAPEKIINK